MHRLLRILSSGFTGFVLGFLLAVLLSRWVWLDMRINIAFLIPVLTLAGLLSGFLLRTAPGIRLTAGLEGLCFVVTLLIYRADLSALGIIPAVLFREGFGIGYMSLTQVNILLFLILAFANAAVIFGNRRNYTYARKERI